MNTPAGSRLHAPPARIAVLVMDARDGAHAESLLRLRSPGVGYWRHAPTLGALIHGGTSIGELEVLGVRHPLLAPVGASGRVVAPSSSDERVVRGAGPVAARAAVDFHSVLLCLDPRNSFAGEAIAGPTASAGASGDACFFRAPTSGRYYGRAGPGKAAFCQVGDIVTTGATVALLEVMKTFHRVSYGGATLPARARVVRIIPSEESDVNAGDPLIEVQDVE